MPKPKKEQTPEDRRTMEMLNELEAEQDKLSSWEKNEFLPSVMDRFYEKGLPLTVKQQETLQKIYDERLRR
jgi:hypothetical protein